MDGPTAVSEVVDQLAGFEVPAAAWEKEILPVRLAPYAPAWLAILSLQRRLKPNGITTSGSPDRHFPGRTDQSYSLLNFCR
jgi:ATP-dependent Lhr-like helicase